jgi:hypothetical protein
MLIRTQAKSSETYLTIQTEMTNHDVKVFLGEQLEVRKCNVSIRIGGDKLIPSEISSTLNLVPTKSFERGQEYLSKSGRLLTHPMGMWHLSTEGHSSKSVEGHCHILLDWLQGKEDVFRQLRSNGMYRVSITFWWDGNGIGHGSFNVLSETLARLSAFCDDFELYFV